MSNPITSAGALRRSVLCGLMLAMAASAAANPRYEAWQKGRPFTLSAWATHEAGGGGTLDLDYFRGSGLNTAYDGRCAYNAARPMPDLGGLPVIYFVYANKLPDLEGFIADLANARKKHNVVALMLGDEVVSSHGEDGLTHYGQIRDWVVDNPDPAIRSLLTITCVPAGDRISATTSLHEYFGKTVDRIRPDVILPQFYPQAVKDGAGETMQGTYYSSLEWLFNWAREKGVALWSCNRAWTSGPPLPSESSLRLQRFSSLAYGIRGMVDFLWVADSNPTIRDAGYWNLGGPNPTVLYRRLAPINRELANLGPAMLQLTPVGAYHMDSRDRGDGVRIWSDSDDALPVHLRRTWRLANVTGPASRNHLLVGFFRDAAGEEYFLVVNKDVGVGKTGEELAAPVTLSFHPSVRGIQRLSRTTGEVETITVEDNYIFTLAGGTGDLIKFDTGKPFAGVRQVAAPRLLQSDPASGGTWCSLFGNGITLSFDGDASEVRAEIRALDENGNAVGEDLGERFARILADQRTLVYRETGAVLSNKSRYLVKLHWADAVPLKISTLRGDVDGDGSISQKDKDATARLSGQKVDCSRADLDSDGYVNETDLQYMDKIASFREFEWTESFESYPVGALSGNGPWLDPQTIPGSVLGKAWVAGPASVTEAGGPLDGPRKVCGARPHTYFGAEARFHDGGGFDSVGVLRVSFVTRVGRGAGYENTGFHIWNSRDERGEFGNFTVEQMRGAIAISAGRGIELDKPQSVTVEGGQGPESKGIRVEFTVDFEASKLIWQCEDLDNGRLHGPFETRYTGTVKGLDGLDVMTETADAHIDGIRVRNY